MELQPTLYYLQIIQILQKQYNFEKYFIHSDIDVFDDKADLVNQILQTNGTIEKYVLSGTNDYSFRDKVEGRAGTLYVHLLPDEDEVFLSMSLLYYTNFFKESNISLLISPMQSMSNATSILERIDDFGMSRVLLLFGSEIYYVLDRPIKLELSDVAYISQIEPSTQYSVYFDNEQHGYLNDFPLIFKYNDYCSGIFCYLNEEYITYWNRLNRRENNQSNEITREIESEVKYILYPLDKHAYPVISTTICLLVPIMNQVSSDQFLHHPFTANVWICLYAFLGLQTLIIRIIYGKNVFDSYRDAFYFMTLSPTICPQRKLTFRSAFIYCILTFYAFIITMFYNAKLSTYLTTLAYDKQLETVEDIVDYNIKILGDFLTRMEADSLLGESFEIMDFKDVIERLLSFDTSSSYGVYSFQWDYIKRSQILLKRRLFAFTNICSKPNGLSYLGPISIAKYYSDLESKMFVIKIQQSGLLKYWEEMSFYKMQEVGNFSFLRDDEEIRSPLDFEFYKVGWIISFFGWFGGLVVFVCEVCSNQ